MMNVVKIKSLLLAVFIGIAAVFSLLGLFTSPVLAQGQESTWYANLRSRLLVQSAQESDGFAPLRMLPNYTLPEVSLTTEATLLTVLDLAGNPIGEGVHGGDLKCIRDNCNKRIRLTVGEIEFEYQFKTLQAFDAEEMRAVVAGTGTIDNGRQKERFSFIATFQDNGDGTVTIRYEASRPDASFIIQRAPGTIEC